MALTKQQKKRLVNRLVERELKGWQAGCKAGEKCALSWLTLSGFKIIVALDAPDIKTLRAVLCSREQSKHEETHFWCNLLGVAGADDLQITEHPDFAPAFVQRVREVWEEVQEEVMDGLKDRPELEADDEPEQEAEVPARPSRRGSFHRCAGRHGIRRRM